MPWKKSDVDSHIKGLSSHQKDVWVATANSALARCEKNGGDNCDATAIRIANAAAKRVKESYLSPTLIRHSIKSDDSSLDLLEALSMLAQDESFDARRSAVCAAVRQWGQMQALTNASDEVNYGYHSYAWVVDLYSDVVIFRWRNQLWRASYTVNSENKATIDSPQRVKLYYAPLDAATNTTTDEGWREVDDPARLFSNRESDETDETENTQESATTQEEILVESEFVPLAEAAVKDNKAKICVITPGWGSTGYYSADVLKRDGPTVFPKGTHMHWDHPTLEERKNRPEGSLDKLAGVLESDATWDDKGFNGPGLYADVKVVESKASLLEEIAPHIGVSIMAPGMVKEGEVEGRKGRIVESLVARPTNAVDFVTIPGRGGKVCELVESARTRIDTEAINKAAEVIDTIEGDEMDREQIEALVKEAVTTAVATATSESNKTITELQATIERQNEVLRQRDAKEAASIEVDRLATTMKLGERAKTRVVALATNGEAPLTEAGGLDLEEIKKRVEKYATEERDYLKAELGARGNTNVVRDLGESASPEDLTLDVATEALYDAGIAMGMSESQAKTFAGK